MNATEDLIKDADKTSTMCVTGNNIINTIEFQTPLGPMLAGATSEGLCLT